MPDYILPTVTDCDCTTDDLICPHCGNPCRVHGLRRNCPQRPIEAQVRNKKPELCVKRGQQELRREICPTCNGSVQVKVFSCSEFGECTIVKQISRIPRCQTCKEYTNAVG